MDVKIEKNTNRKYHRIELPAKVSIDGITYEVKDWSLGGFMIVDMKVPFAKDWEGKANLLLPFEKVEIAVEVSAKAAWVGPDRAGFSFLDVSPRVKNILKYYLNASIEGNLGEMEGVLSYVNAPEIALPTEIPMTPDEEIAFRRKFFLRSGIYWILAIIAVLIIGTIAFYSMTNAKSLRAIVAKPKISVIAPFTGKIMAIYKQPGDDVMQGDILASLDDQEIKRKIETQKRAVAIAEKELKEARAWLNMVKQGEDFYSEVNVHANVAVFEARVEIKTAEIEKEQAKLREILGELENTILHSPCDGRVYVSAYTVGADVKDGDELFVLQPNSEKDIFILARFTFEDAKGIAIGSKADIFIPTLRKRVSGTVEAIGHQALSGARSSSPDLEISLTEVPVKILLDEQGLVLDNGIPVDVTINTSIKSRLGFFS